ncbi:glycosyltransferase [Virgibacillus sp. 179-BFC.A HS]|uniref:Glycosyltransferase n=1 Tax=Tigheibacillus jepli TaxID=3035914 RepID=A0ABU5CGB5_9BACI|nr:glycosyltransferase [Virgibacillus sp. 179-BFC.A HS]MDY0405041.1 glycosyltransferase [Virgibacillus sp. 179-BFC.A HS]
MGIPKGCFVIDLHWSPSARRKYIEDNGINLVFSVTKHPFLKVFPELKEKLCWIPWSINPAIMKDWGMEKDIDSLLMGLVYVDKENRGRFALPRKIPPRGRYLFRDVVFEKMKDVSGFVFHPHPGHRVTKSDLLIANEDYAKELNRAKLFFTCGSRNETGGVAVLKFFEAPACKTLLLAEENDDIKELGFVDKENFISCTINNVVENANYYLAHDDERIRITENGYKFIHQYHTNEQRAKQIIQAIETIL